MNFIILAAGIGSRLRPLTEDRPKCCIKINQNSIISMLLSQINEYFNSANIIIVTGYKDDYLKNHVKSKFNNIKFVHNSDYESTNNMYSARLAVPKLNEDDDVVIVNADCIFEDKIFKILSKTKETTILTDKSFFDEESMKAKIKDNHVIGMSKAFTNAEDIIVSLDMYMFTHNDFNKLVLIFDSYIEKGEITKWTEVAINDLAHKNKNMIKNKDIKNSFWHEIDTLEDLRKARDKWNVI